MEKGLIEHLAKIRSNLLLCTLKLDENCIRPKSGVFKVVAVLKVCRGARHHGTPERY